MKKLLVLAILMASASFAHSSESCDSYSKERPKTEKERKKEEKARIKEQKQRKKEKYKELDEGYKLWRESEHAKNKVKSASTYFSPDKGQSIDGKIKRAPNGDRV